MGEPTFRIFIHRFSPSVQGEIRVPDQPPPKGQTVQLEHYWTGRPKRKHIPAYRQWVLFVTQSLADRWDYSILYGLGVAENLTELWRFEPGQAPKLIEKLPLGL